MAWIYFPESEGLASPLTPGCKLSPTVSKTLIAKVFCCPECRKINLIEPQSGTMLEALPEICCRKLTSSSEDFHAKISVLQATERAWKESEVAFFGKLSDLQKKLIRRLSSWKTSPELELKDFDKLSEHLPKWGMIVGGLVYLPQALEPRIKEKDGCYLPTPTATPYGRNKSLGPNSKVRPSLQSMATNARWPTPLARDGKVSPGAARATYSLPGKVGGKLNPTWVEWLMGFPLGWTELSPSVIALSLYKFERGLKSYQARLLRKKNKNGV